MLYIFLASFHPLRNDNDWNWNWRRIVQFSVCRRYQFSYKFYLRIYEMHKSRQANAYCVVRRTHHTRVYVIQNYFMWNLSWFKKKDEQRNEHIFSTRNSNSIHPIASKNRTKCMYVYGCTIILSPPPPPPLPPLPRLTVVVVAKTRQNNANQFGFCVFYAYMSSSTE